MEDFITRGWEFILPGCGGTSALARGAALAARWLHELQPISNHSVGLGFHTLRGGIDPGNLRVRPRVVGVVEIWKDLLPEDGNLSSPGCAGSMYDPQSISNRLVGLRFPHRAGRFRPG